MAESVKAADEAAVRGSTVVPRRIDDSELARKNSGLEEELKAARQHRYAELDWP